MNEWRGGSTFPELPFSSMLKAHGEARQGKVARVSGLGIQRLRVGFSPHVCPRSGRDAVL